MEKKKGGEWEGSSGCDEKIMRQIRPVSVQWCGHIGTTWQEWILVEMLKDNRQRWKLGWNPEKWLELKFWLSGKAAKELLQGGCEPHSKRSRLWIYNLTNKSYLHPYHSLIKTCFWRLSQFIFPSLKKEEIAVDFKADAYKAYMHSIQIMHFENMTELDNVREWLDCWKDWWLK